MADTSGATHVPVHVVLPASILARSPSAQDGIDASTERAHRFFGCELIQEAGVLLRLPQVVMATAQSTLQRFYYRKSLRDFDAFRVAAACLFLAAKVEERPKRMRDVLSVFYALYKRRKWHRTRPEHQLLDLDSATYSDWRDWLALVERQVLIDLGFSLYNVMEHPHKYILYYVKIVDGSDALAQRAWGYVNDSLRTDLCVRYRSEVVACAAIFLASRMLQVKLPDDPHWYALCGVDRRALYTASAAIMALYSLDTVAWLEPLTAVNPFAVDDTDDASDDALMTQSSASREHAMSLAPSEVAATGATADDAKVLDAAASPVSPESVGGAASAAAVAPIQSTVVGATGAEAEVALQIAAAIATAAAEARVAAVAAQVEVVDALEDALIDEFDAPSLLLDAPQEQQQRPLVSAQLLRHDSAHTRPSASAARERRATCYQHMPTPPLLTCTSAGALYPSFAALGTGSTSSSAAVSTPQTAAPHVAVANAQPLYAHMFEQEQQHALAADGAISSPLIASSPLPRRVEWPHLPPLPLSLPQQQLQGEAALSAPPEPRQPPQPHTPAQAEEQPAQEPSPVRASVVPELSQRELDAKQRELEREVAGYEQQLDYVALALAGNTPHQVAERARRERERQAREQQRLLATEERVLHQLERLHEREQRRAKVRTHVTHARTASRSPSPEARPACETDQWRRDACDDAASGTERASASA